MKVSRFTKKLMRVIFNPERVANDIIKDDLEYVRQRKDTLHKGKLYSNIEKEYLESILSNPFDRESQTLLSKAEYAFDTKNDQLYFFVRYPKTIEYSIYNSDAVLVIVGEKMISETVLHIPVNFTEKLSENKKLVRTLERIQLIEEKEDAKLVLQPGE